MAGEPTPSILLGAGVFLREHWTLRVFCKQCLDWRTVHLARLGANAKAGRVIDVVARLRCQACHQQPTAVRAEFYPPSAMRRTPLYRVELLRCDVWGDRPLPGDSADAVG